jgi:hypothetical protein
VDDGPKGEAARAESGGCVVERLVEILGSRLVAVIAGVSQTSTLREWIKGGPPADRLTVLQLALKIASEIAARHDERTAQSWFQGANQALSDRTPALALRSMLSLPLPKSVEEATRIDSAALIFLNSRDVSWLRALRRDHLPSGRSEVGLCIDDRICGQRSRGRAIAGRRRGCHPRQVGKSASGCLRLQYPAGLVQQRRKAA